VKGSWLSSFTSSSSTLLAAAAALPNTDPVNELAFCRLGKVVAADFALEDPSNSFPYRRRGPPAEKIVSGHFHH